MAPHAHPALTTLHLLPSWPVAGRLDPWEGKVHCGRVGRVLAARGRVGERLITHSGLDRECARDDRRMAPGTAARSDLGMQSGFRAFTRHLAKESGPVSSMGSIRDRYDDAVRAEESAPTTRKPLRSDSRPSRRPLVSPSSSVIGSRSRYRPGRVRQSIRGGARAGSSTARPPTARPGRFRSDAKRRTGRPGPRRPSSGRSAGGRGRGCRCPLTKGALLGQDGLPNAATG